MCFCVFSVFYLCVSVSLSRMPFAGRQRPRSAQRRQLDVPRYQRTTLGRWAFSVAGRTVWNSLSDELRDETENTFRQSLKHCFSDNIRVLSAFEVFYDNEQYKSTLALILLRLWRYIYHVLTYLLTYLRYHYMQTRCVKWRSWYYDWVVVYWLV